MNKLKETKDKRDKTKKSSNTQTIFKYTHTNVIPKKHTKKILISKKRLKPKNEKIVTKT